MRTVGMLQRGTGAACLLVLTIGCAYALPLQLLPDIPGYIPVYIRHGDQPLEDINPDLAEAFHESGGHTKNVRQIQLGQMSENIEASIESSNEDEKSRERIAPLLKSVVKNGLYDEGNEMIAEKLGRRTPIEVPKNSVLKVDGISEAEERELVNLASEIEREETKPNDLYDTNISNPLYSRQSHPEINERHGSRGTGSITKLRPIPKWPMAGSAESQRGFEEVRPDDRKDDSEEDSSSKEVAREEKEEDEEEKEYVNSNVGKVINRNYEPDSNVNAKDFEVDPEERIKDLEEENDE